MNYVSFQFLVLEIKEWITSNALIFVREPLPVYKVVGLGLYRLVHGCAVTFMTNWFCVGVSIVHECVNIIIDILIDDKNLFIW